MDKLGSKAIIGPGAKFTGTITDARTIEIHGDVNADLTADKVIIGEKGRFDGAISADLVVVSGEYDGCMEAGSIWATSTARISGNVKYNTLQMDRGAALNCHVVHNWVGDEAQERDNIANDDKAAVVTDLGELETDSPVTANADSNKRETKDTKRKKGGDRG